MSRLGVFLVLLLCASFAFAHGGGVEVSAAEAGLVSVKPREIMTRVVRVTNRSGAPGNFEGVLVLPDGWRTIAPEFPFVLAPGASTMRLLSFVAPEHTAAGDYRVSYQVVNRDTRALGGVIGYQVQIQPVYRLQVDILELPAGAIVGETYSAVFQVGNYGNSTLTVGFGAESSRGSKIRPAAGTLTLAPGESRPVELTIQPAPATEAVWDQIRLTASAPDHGLTGKAERVVETLPRTSGREDLYHKLHTQYTQRMGINWGDRLAAPAGGGNEPKLRGGFQIEWSGNGPLDDSGERFLAFLLRGPDLSQTTLFGQPSWFFVDYRGKEFDWGLGNLVFTLSPLTELGAGGFGARVGWHSPTWRAFAWHSEPWNLNQAWNAQPNWYAGTGLNNYYGGQETAVSLAHALRPNWWLSANWLMISNRLQGTNQVVSLRQQVELQPDLRLDLELAGSNGDLGSGMGYWLDLAKTGAPWRYRINLLHTDPQFAGEYQDQDRAHLDLRYESKDSPWAIWGFYRYDRYNQAQLRYRYDLADRWLYVDQERLVLDPARDEENAGVGISWRAAGSGRWSAELRYGECRNASAAATPFYDVTQSVRLGYNRQFKDPDLSLDLSLDMGRRFDHVTGRTVPAQGYRATLLWHAAKRLTLGAWINDAIDPCMGRTMNGSPTVGLNASLWFDQKSSLNLSVQGQQTQGRYQVMANAQYSYRRDNGDIIAIQAQYGSGTFSDANLMLSYTMPIDVPAMRRTDVTTLRGQVLDQETGRGLANVVLKMDQVVAVTDERGNFSFPSVKRGLYELTVAGGKLPVGMIPADRLPVQVDLESDWDASVQIPYIRGVTIGGIVQTYEPDPALLPSQTFVKVGQGGAGRPPPPEARELKPTRGLGGLLVEVRSGDQVFRRLTNGNGEFRFAGLSPGTWTVKIDPAALPENATIEESSFTLEAKPGAEERVEFKVEQKTRSMRMLAPLKASG